MSMEDSGVISKNIVYRRPPFYKRVFANLVDFLIFICVFIFSFVGIRAIVSSTPEYVKAESELTRVKTESGLYIRIVETGYLMDVVTYWSHQDDSMGHKKANLYFAIENFLSFCDEECLSEDALEIRKSYDDYRLDGNLKFDGVTYFVKNEQDKIIENPLCNASAADYFNVYGNYIDVTAQGYLVTKIPNYMEYQKFQSDMFIYVELLISYPLSVLLVYFVPPLIFKRGRKTFGKLLYKIGLVEDSTCLNVKTGKIIARQAIVSFGEMILSPFTFCIPIIISFSMMAFSKKKQSFPDYMLSLTEIDTTYDKIYHSKDEIILEEIHKDNSGLKFKQTKEI